MHLLFLTLLAVGALSVPAPYVKKEKETYAGHRLLTVRPETREQVEALHQLETGDLLVDFWLMANQGQNATFRVPPETYDDVSEFLQENNLEATVVHPDLEAMLKELERKEAEIVARMGGLKESPDTVEKHTFYRTLTEINRFLDLMATRYPSMATVGTLTPKTHQGHSTRYIELKAGKSNTAMEKKKRVFVECGAHAREWISPAVCLYFIERVLNNYGSDPEATAMLDKYHWTVVPTMNPDGYEYSHTIERYWRKNRNPQPCVFPDMGGVDLNRNWDAKWGTSGVSHECYSENYLGKSPFSEPETRGIRDYIKKNPSSVYLSFHSYSQLILLPYGYAPNQEPSNGAQHRSIARNAQKAIAKTHGKRYQVGTPPELIYSASGCSADWAKMKGGAEFTWTYELRPANGGIEAFVLPPREIVPCAEEVWASLVVISSQT